MSIGFEVQNKEDKESQTFKSVALEVVESGNLSRAELENLRRLLSSISRDSSCAIDIIDRALRSDLAINELHIGEIR